MTISSKKTEKQKTPDYAAWVPFASYLTTGQFASLRSGFVHHCGPTAAANLIRTLKKRLCNSLPEVPAEDDVETLFLMCADAGRQMGIYWNRRVFGRFGGTSNLMTGIFLRRCLNKAGLHGKVKVRFHPWITPDAVAEALDREAVVYLEVMLHPKYKNHHMICYSYRYWDEEKGPLPEARTLTEKKKSKKPVSKESGPFDGKRKGRIRHFLLADGWTPGPVWIDEKELGHGHFLTIRMS